MSDHPRKAIRDAVKTILTGATDAGEKVYTNRARHTFPAELPVILVYTTEENSEVRAVSPNAELARTLKLVIEIPMKADDTLDDRLDAIALQVETVMGRDDTLGGTANFSFLSGTVMGLDAESKYQIGALVMTFDVNYYGFVNEDVAENDLTEVHTKIDTAPEDGQIEIEGDVTLAGG